MVLTKMKVLVANQKCMVDCVALGEIRLVTSSSLATLLAAKAPLRTFCRRKLKSGETIMLDQPGARTQRQLSLWS